MSLAYVNGDRTREELVVPFEVDLKLGSPFHLSGIEKSFKANRAHLGMLEVRVHIRARNSSGPSGSEAAVLARHRDKHLVGGYAPLCGKCRPTLNEKRTFCLDRLRREQLPAMRKLGTPGAKEETEERRN